MAQGTPAPAGEHAAGASGSHPSGTSGGHAAGSRLGAYLCWAVVFADIGTSVYYVPGILYNYSGIGRLAGFFVLLTLVAFLLLTLKYAEVSVRFPEGGGVVTVATHGINPWAGAVGGMFILVDYFLTSAISSLSGLLYFQAILPRLGAVVHIGLGRFAVPVALTLLITLVVIALLGVLNWFGIKESASVSAVIATAAFLSDIVILLLIVVRVPLATVGQVFAAMFTGKTMTPLLVLTGFAGAFLAFSGLESISQLSPVMQLPRKKTVTAALAFVVCTVGITSPLLTMFSTVLLTDPKFSSVLAVPRYAQYHMANPATFDPNQFISLLAGAYGGRILEVATAVVASCLLIFASNTAIIGAYHVFLALSRMRFFPAFVEVLSKRRGTPIVSIVLATGIPMAVLIAVNGNVNTLGDLYAFGLLGAFSLTCLSMDIIRFRERHGAHHVGAEVDPELLGAPGYVNSMPANQPPPVLVRVYDALVPPTLRDQIRQAATRAAQEWHPLAERLKQPMSTFTYYIGFLTTALVIVAWVTNLYFKPLATFFGGGITALGVGIAVFHYQYLQRRGEPAVFLDAPTLLPDSWLVVLSPISNHSKKVIQAAVESARGRPLAFLYLSPNLPDQAPPRLFEIRDRFGHDRAAQKVLSIAKRDAGRHHLNAKFYYAVGGAKQVFDIARRVRPDEIVAEAHTAKSISHAAPSEAGMAISPEYVRYQPIDGLNVAHYVLHELYARGPDTNMALSARGLGSSPAAPAAQKSSPDGAVPTQSGQPPAASATQPPHAPALPESTPNPASNAAPGSGPSTNPGAAAPPNERQSSAEQRSQWSEHGPGGNGRNPPGNGRAPSSDASDSSDVEP